MPEQIRIHLPPKSEQESIARVLHLSREQSATLWIAVDRIVSEIKNHQTTRLEEQDRRSPKAWLRNAIKAFDDLGIRLGKPRNSTTDQLLRRTVLPILAELLGHHGLERLAGSPSDSTLSGRDREEREFDERELNLSDRDRRTLSNRLNFAAAVGPQLIQNLLVNLSEPLRHQLRLEMSIDKGGRPGRRYRNYVIQELVPVYIKLFGRPATSTPAGEFTLLCSQVLTSVGIDETGLDTAVSRILRGPRATRARRSS
jgi:hypothetical protein